MAKKKPIKKPAIKQDPLVVALETGDKKAIMRFADRALSFREFNQTINFLNAISFQIVNGGGKGKKIAAEIITRARHRFTALPHEEYLWWLLMYQRHLHKLAREKPGTAYFSIAETLGGTQLGDIDGAKKIMRHLIFLFNNYRFPETEKGKEKQLALFSFLTEIIAITGITHTWRNFVSGIKTDSETRQMLVDILHILYGYSIESFELVPEQSWNPNKDLSYTSPHIAMIKVGLLDQKCKLPIPQSCLDEAKKILAEVQEEIQSISLDLTFFLSGFFHDKAKIEELFALMWEEICMPGKKAGLRSDGQDRVEIEIPVLRNAGYRYFQLIREGQEFPRAKVRFWIKSPSGTLYSTPLNLEPKKLSEYQKAGLSEDDPHVSIDLMQAFIGTMAYWRITCGRDRVFEGKGKKTSSHTTSVHAVRPFFRKLPDNWQASEEATARSVNLFGQAPPRGCTFVKEHKRGPASQEKRYDDRPLFGIKEADLTSIMMRI